MSFRSFRTSDDWAMRLVRRAARRSPADLAERLEEEWLADLATHRHPFARLRFAFGCTRAGVVLAADPVAFGAAPAAAAPHMASVAVLPRREFIPRRTLVLFVIVGIHAVLIYAFTLGLPLGRIPAVETVLHGSFVIDPPKPNIPLPTIPRPDSHQLARAPRDHIASIPVEVPPIDLTDDGPTFTLPGPVDPPVAPSPVKRMPGSPGANFPTTSEFYPPVSRQLGEAGAVVVQACVDKRGRLTGAPEVQTSSGFERLDAAALALAKAGSGRYRSATEDGTPVASCFPFRVRFALR